MALHTPHKNSSVLLDTHGTMLITLLILSLNGTEYSTPSLVKAYARKAQFGQIFTFYKRHPDLTDGVFRTSARGWYSFSHIALAFSFSLAICGMLVLLSSKTFGQV